MTDIHLFVI